MSDSPQTSPPDTSRSRPLTRRLHDAITRVELAFGAVMLLVILVLVFAQAAQRHLPVTAAAWTGEVSRFGLAWLTLGLAGVLITLRGHITLEVLDIVPKPQFVRFVQAFALVVTAVIAAGLAREAFALVQSQGALRSPVLRMPMSWFYLPVLLGMVSTVIRSALGAWTVLRHGPYVSASAADTASSHSKEQIA
ncbi:TRAP transporter small permease [Nesterenkonia sp. NBAIMH1]|uniref:TRAP transporter small permease n=1 Tax=Nesterenkonia sp. NBAIMH1 TaxID=2600320 RepID=UPI0011B3C6A4|nr:TRAP transporter small permease subunit [Nesterenkonia sp. NBAIMH1]